jgi:hypothetical protein
MAGGIASRRSSECLIRLTQMATGRDASGAMKHSKAARRRCTECRKWFHAAASARQTQKVCSGRCRRVRDQALARARRAQDLDRHREDERERQSKCRRARREKLGRGPPRVRVTARHTPPSCAKFPELHDKVLESWDKAVALSRASLGRELSETWAEIERSAGTAQRGEARCHAPA